MSNIFKKADIKAGYLLRVKAGDKEVNMTVVPTRENTVSLAANLFLGQASTAAGDLACCGEGRWWPLNNFNGDLETRFGNRVMAVYGYTHPSYLLDNSTDGRELLWEREAVKKMTLEEIEKALGYKVKVVKAGDTAPDLFKKSCLCAGQVVQLRKGEKRVVVPTEDGLVLANGCGEIMTYYNLLKEYRDDLTNIKPNTKHLDIVKVWSRVETMRHLSNTFTATDEGRKLLWERDDTKRMTVAEIAEALGYPVEIVEG